MSGLLFDAIVRLANKSGDQRPLWTFGLMASPVIHIGSTPLPSEYRAGPIFLIYNALRELLKG